ncbi:MAG: flagellar hook-associated protein FlgK [Firmicutes bacterium]|nr:flagellar hook-associated protein FlgK [Bacillota bacterium]
MRSTFFGIQTGLRGLMAQQRALDTTGHNIANANTPGYSRQVTNLTTTSPYTVPSFGRPAAAGQIGTGVAAEAVERMRSAFLDDQIRNESETLGYWAAQSETLTQVEGILGEPSNSGLRNALDAFWKSMQDLSLHPESMPIRAIVRQRGVELADMIQHTYAQLSDTQKSVDQAITLKVDEINGIARQIADLNDQISKAVGVGLQPNDLLDRRDLLVTKLSKMVNVSTFNGENGALTVNIGGISLVAGEQAHQLTTVPNAANNNLVDVQWADFTNPSPPPALLPADVTNGELKGMLDVRDVKLAGYMTNLNDLATGLIAPGPAQSVNSRHQAGFDLTGAPGGVFFTAGSNASNITVDAAILNGDPGLRLIAASSTAAGVPGDGSNALSIAQLNQAKLMNGGTATYSEFLGAMVSNLGVDSDQAKTMETNQTTLIDHLTKQSESIAGVSLDEEAANMMKFQHGYDAAARVITTMDEMIDVIINRMGVVGR